MAASPPADRFEELYAVVRKSTGLDLSEYKQDQLRRRLLTWAEGRGDHDFAALGTRLAKDPAEMRALFDRISINVSELYRNPERWSDLAKRVLPDLGKRATRLKCWSAGCSFGAEAHTLAAVLETGGYRASIVGTDIDEDALATARAGLFEASSMRNVPVDVRNKHFSPAPNGTWQAADSLRRNLRFRTGNLLDDRFDEGFDLILCRNVVIYFRDETKDRLYRKFLQALKPGGVLFVGGTERIFDAKGMGFESPLPFFYQKPLRAQDQWRNAS